MNQDNEGRYLRWAIYCLLIGLSSASAIYRILEVNVLDVQTRQARDVEGSPMLCANDRSRWCTIRSLGDNDRYEIDEILADPDTGEFSFDRKLYDRYWVTIDLVKHRDRTGEMRYYSSKPTLFPTMLAYVYKAFKTVTGKTITEDTFVVVRTLLIIVNVIPMAILLIVLAATLEILSEDTFTKIVLVAAASFGTFLTPFAVTLNNHLPAAVSAGIALFALVHIYRNSHCSPVYYFLAGVFSAFAAANELPALSFFCFTGLLVLIRQPSSSRLWNDGQPVLLLVGLVALTLGSLYWGYRQQEAQQEQWGYYIAAAGGIGTLGILGGRTFLFFVPGAAIVIAGFFWTNHRAHADWIPAYAHRTDGEVVMTIDASLFGQIETSQMGSVPADLINKLNRYSDEIGFKLSSSATIAKGQMPLAKGVKSRFVLTQSDDSQRLAIVKPNDGDAEVRMWNNWYEYPESRWLIQNKGGVDKGEPDPKTYAFHCLVGHHGVFSLTPMWLLSLMGMPLLFQGSFRRYGWIGLMIIVVSVVVVAFYLTRPLEDRNYGGGTSALRWLLWMAPLWIVAAVPFVEILSRSIWGKIVVVLLVAGSIGSAHYSAMNPWVHPWIYELLVKLEWIKPFG